MGFTSPKARLMEPLRTHATGRPVWGDGLGAQRGPVIHTVRDKDTGPLPNTLLLVPRAAASSTASPAWHPSALLPTALSSS